MTEELLRLFNPYIESLTLIPSSGGRFEVTVNDDLIYRKKATGRHAAAGEITQLFQEKTGLQPLPEE